MGLPLFYAKPEDIDTTSGRLDIEGPEASHMVRSLRVREGDLVTVGDGAGSVFRVKVTAASRDRLEAGILDSRDVLREKPFIRLMMAASRPSSMDSAVRRAAECGVGEMVPFQAPRSSSGAPESEVRLERLRRIALESSKTARRAWPLTVAEPLGWPPESGEGTRVLLWEEEFRLALEDALPEVAPAVVTLISGPEGGFSQEDARLLQSGGATPVSVGSNILRAESAGALAALLIRFHYGLLTPCAG